MHYRRPKRRQEPPPIIPHGEAFTPEGPHYSRSWETGHAREWLAFRKSLGLSDTRYLAKLLGVSVRSIQRWEYVGPAPWWYHAALLGLRDVWGVALRDK